MLQYSKLIYSRDEWKQKAAQRAYEVRELKKTTKRLKIKIAKLHVENTEFALLVDDGKKNG
jgi:hypothetical protein